MSKKDKVEEATGLFAGLRSLAFGAIDEVEDRVLNLITVANYAVTEIVSRVFDYGKGLVLGLTSMVFDFSREVVTQGFALAASLVVLVIGSKE